MIRLEDVNEGNWRFPLVVSNEQKAYPCKDDPNRIVKRVRYVCYGKTRKQT